jgi:choline dehydrogenase
MHKSGLLALLTLSPAASAFGATKVNGKTQLFGNSYGILAQNVTYDYVVCIPSSKPLNMKIDLAQIVGGGTAGLTVASRLAANPNVSVAVIEAGSFYEMENGNTSQVPGYGSRYLTFNDLAPSPVLVDWGLITEPQEVGARAQGQQACNC